MNKKLLNNNDPQGTGVVVTGNRRRQIWAMVKKNYWVKRQNKKGFFFELFLPVIVVIYLKFVIVN